jgi:(p)ppGpp synthase/HD superfamily hydrolase
MHKNYYSKNMSTLENAISIAIEAHRGEVDQSGVPYILHPLRLMMQMDTEEEMIVAVLHDVVEDGNVNISMLRDQGFTQHILDAIVSVTRKENESYEDFIERVSSNALGRKIKCADLMDNLNISRLRKLTDRDLNRITKYHQALMLLKKTIPDRSILLKGPNTLFLGEI